MKHYMTGLVVGKFAPLHFGHERLIQAAAAQCERLLVLSYSRPEMPDCEPSKREKWLRDRFPDATILVATPEIASSFGVLPMPDNDADEHLHRRFCAQLCLKAFNTTIDAVFTAEDYGDGFAAVLQQEFNAHGGAARRVVHVRLNRQEHPQISGTLLRGDIHGHRSFLAPSVYADFVHRMCILGGESSGKSTLAEALAKALDAPHVSEYGREFWEKHEGKLVFEDMLYIAQTQIIREEAACAGPFLICDTSPLTTLFYSRSMYGNADVRLEELAKRRYDTTILCKPDFPFVQDGTRQSDAFRQEQHCWYKDQLQQRGIAYLEVQGCLAQRVESAVRYLRRFENLSIGV